MQSLKRGPGEDRKATKKHRGFGEFEAHTEHQLREAVGRGPEPSSQCGAASLAPKDSARQAPLPGLGAEPEPSAGPSLRPGRGRACAGGAQPTLCPHTRGKGAALGP